MAQPQVIYSGAFHGVGSVGESAYLTFSVSIANLFEIQVPVKVFLPNTNQTAGAQVTVYRSTDGGNSYETTGTIVSTFPNNPASATMIQDINLSRGVYLVSVCIGGAGVAATYSVDFGVTCEMVTAYA